MRRVHRFWIVSGCVIVVFIAVCMWLLPGGHEPLRLAPISGDASALDPYQISFSLANSRLEQRFTLCLGEITKDTRVLESGHHWNTPIKRRTLEEPEGSFLYYQYVHGAEKPYYVQTAAQGTAGPRAYRVGEQHTPLLELETDETIEGFWVVKDEAADADHIYSAVQHGGDIELLCLDGNGGIAESYPLDRVPEGYFFPAERTTERRTGEHMVSVALDESFPPEPDGAQIIPLDNGQVLVIGAWVAEEDSGVDLYLLEPEKMIYHGRISTDIWKDYQKYKYEYQPENIEDAPHADAEVRYFTLPEVKTRELAST